MDFLRQLKRFLPDHPGMYGAWKASLLPDASTGGSTGGSKGGGAGDSVGGGAGGTPSPKRVARNGGSGSGSGSGGVGGGGAFTAQPGPRTLTDGVEVLDRM